MRAETLFLKKKKMLEFVDVARQTGYLVGMVISYGFYQISENIYLITDKKIQVYNIHFLLLFIQLCVVFFLLRSFKKV